MKWNVSFLLRTIGLFVSFSLNYAHGKVNVASCTASLWWLLNISVNVVFQKWDYCQDRKKTGTLWIVKQKTHTAQPSCCILPSPPPPRHYHRLPPCQIISTKSILIRHHSAPQSEDNPWHFYHSPPFYLVCALPCLSCLLIKSASRYKPWRITHQKGLFPPRGWWSVKIIFLCVLWVAA